MSLKKEKYDMTIVQAGLGVGCTIVTLFIIFILGYFIKQLYDYFKNVQPRPSHPIKPRPHDPLPTPPVRIPTPHESPPPYHTVVPIVPRSDSFIRRDERTRANPPIRPDPPTPEPVHSSRRESHDRSRTAMESVASLPEVDVSRPVYPGKVVEVKCLLPICQEYFQSLHLDYYFQRKYDCFCRKCCPNNGQKTRKRGGYNSTIPYGWVRFRIQTDPAHAGPKKIFQRWATSYYGTCEEKLEKILRNRLIPLPGDTLADGTIFSDHSGYEKQCLTSPSINYASDLRFSPIKTFRLPNGRNEIYDVQVVLQCKQSPQTFVVQAGRPGLCNVIPPNEIEWKSNQRSTLIPIGLMIRMNKK